MEAESWDELANWRRNGGAMATRAAEWPNRRWGGRRRRRRWRSSMPRKVTGVFISY